MDFDNNPASQRSLDETSLPLTPLGSIYPAAMLVLTSISIAVIGWFAAELVLSNMTDSICYEELSHYGEFNSAVIALASVGAFVWSAFGVAVVLTASNTRVWWVSFCSSIVMLLLAGIWQLFVLLAIGWCQ